MILQPMCKGVENTSADANWFGFIKWICLWDHAVMLPYLLRNET